MSDDINTLPLRPHTSYGILAKQSSVALEQISEALTHSDTSITRTYVITPNVIQVPISEIAYRKLSQKDADRNGVNSKKTLRKTTCETPESIDMKLFLTF